jgi:hypothetical protein
MVFRNWKRVYVLALLWQTKGENMKHKPMATYNRKGYDKGDILVIVVCFALFIAIAVMEFAGWLPGGV